MISLKDRSFLPEMLDGNDIPEKELFKNLKEIDSVNRLLGGHHATLAGIKKLVTNPNKKYHIVDFGCGSGDSLKYIAKWLLKNNFNAQLTGVDINQSTCEYAKNNCIAFNNIQIINKDFRDAFSNSNSIDIGISCLFCHHLNDAELIEYIELLKNKCKSGFIINDLHRHPIAYYSILFLTKLLNGTDMVKNDAPLSVRKAFLKTELEAIMIKSGIINFAINWIWAFRFLVTAEFNESH